MNTPVNYEIAKLLKEKGIKIESSQDDEIYGYCYCKYYKGSDYKLVSNYTLNFTQDSQRYDYVTSPVYEAPTIADVIMWLYEKHDIWISLIPDSSSGHQLLMRKMSVHLFRYRNGLNVQTETLRNIDGNIIYFLSPTEAYEAAIEYILNNLI